MRVPATYVDQQRFPHDVLVVRLSSAECEIAGDRDSAAEGSAVRFFIGAIGPIDGRMEDRHGDGLTIRFAQPLDRQIVEHFQAA